MEIILTIFGALVTFSSFIFAIYSHTKNIKLINFNRDQAWDNYHQASEVLAVYQRLEKMDITNSEAKCLIAKGEAEARILAKNSIKMIKRFEKQYDEKSIKKWAEENRLHSGESHIDTFMQYVD
ncbi:MAG: hypothetical protein PHY34_06040 [Patescibacteria group bacterium]|nr:hypothetical protein [Patescibacteria group bacterium]